MGTITSRKRNDGSLGHTAQIRLKKDGRITHTESKTFDRKASAQAWLKKRETELAEHGVKPKLVDATLAEVIDIYNKDKEKNKPNGKTKDQVLRTIRNSDLGELRCSEITSQRLVKFAKDIDAQPQTVGNYMSHLSSVFRVAKPAWSFALDQQAMDDARIVLKNQGHISKSKERSRRPTLVELEKLLTHYTLAERKRSDCIPMTRVILFAIFSTRRQEEITRLAVEDLDQKNEEIIVRDMKNPGEKIGNDVRTTLTTEAIRLIDLQQKTSGLIWPYNAESISASFTRACALLGIDDLHFHDLRHEGISRLFELGWQIPKVATVSGHRTWISLKRYTHIRQTGDKYAGWPWMDKVLGQVYENS